MQTRQQLAGGGG